MTTTVTTNIAVSKRGDAYEVKIVPPVTRVPNNDGDKTAKLVWTCSGAAFSSADPFRWKAGGNSRPDVRPDSGKLVSAEYTKNTSSKSVNWEYEFTIQIAGGPTLVIDPEVENLPPGMP